MGAWTVGMLSVLLRRDNMLSVLGLYCMLSPLRLSVCRHFVPRYCSQGSAGIRTLCPLYSGCGRTLGVLCGWNSVAALVRLVFVLCFCQHSAVTPGKSRSRLHCNGALVMGVNAKLRRDINSLDFSTCLLLIHLVWVAVDITSYHSLNRVDIKLHNRSDTPCHRAGGARRRRGRGGRWWIKNAYFTSQVQLF